MGRSGWGLVDFVDRAGLHRAVVERVDDDDNGGWRLNDDNRSRGGDDYYCGRWDDRDHGGRRFDDALRGCWPFAVVGRSAAAARELDEPHIHHDCGGVEYRMGIQVFSRPGGGRVVPGVRDAGGLGAHGNARDQRDGGLGAIGHSAELARSSDVGRAGSRELYLGRQGHWFVARIADSAENGSADPSAARQSAVAVVPGSSSLASSSSSSSKKL